MRLHITTGPGRFWFLSRTVDGPGVVLSLGRIAVALTWGEWA